MTLSNTKDKMGQRPDIRSIVSLPSKWKFQRICFLADIFPSNVDKKSDEMEDPVELCNYTDVYYNDVIDEGIEFMTATASEKQIGKFSLQEGDILLTKDSETWDDIGVPSYVGQNLPNVLCGYHLFLVRPDYDRVDPYFLYWALESRVLAFQFAQAAKGVTRYGISTYEVSTVEIPLPPLQYQRQVGQFLESETGQIDILCDKIGSTPEVLQEKRLAIITAAVTGQIDVTDWEPPEEQEEVPA